MLVEVQRGLDEAGSTHIFSLPDKRPLFDATHLAYNVQEDIAKKREFDRNKMRPSFGLILVSDTGVRDASGVRGMRTLVSEA